jgi:hypothetical protein
MIMTRKRCGATIEGPETPTGVVMWRKSCRARPMRGFDHCRHHLFFDEYRRYLAEKQEKTA